jgi:hypothetical protein
VTIVRSNKNIGELDVSKLPFDPYQFIKALPDWDNIDFDEEE